MNPVEEHYRERMKRIGELQVRKVGAVSPALAEFLLGVCRQRVQTLLQIGRLESFPAGGARLIPLKSIIDFAKSSRRRHPSLLRRSLKDSSVS